MESEGLVVSGALKFPVTRQTRKTSHVEIQTHGFEVDLVGANRDKLVLATVKSFFGSRGVAADHVTGKSAKFASLYAMLNDPIVREGVSEGAATRFGYDLDQVELRLYVGKFAGGDNEQRVREWCATQNVGSGPVAVVGASDVVRVVRRVAGSKTYRDSAVIAALKVLGATNNLATASAEPGYE
jgi:hypothetical protein